MYVTKISYLMAFKIWAISYAIYLSYGYHFKA